MKITCEHIIFHSHCKNLYSKIDLKYVWLIKPLKPLKSYNIVMRDESSKIISMKDNSAKTMT